MRVLAEDLGFALDKSKIKENPGQYRGDFADFMKLIRLAVTGTNRTPNLFYVFNVMGKERVMIE
jgi:glutamyl-tRNA synthetase